MKTFTASTLAFMATLLPAIHAAPAYIPWAYNPSVPGIHNKTIAANEGTFYINKNVTARCPDYDPDCPAKNTTIITGPTYSLDSSEDQWWMGILEPGGQTLFTGARLHGALQYAAAASGNQIDYRDNPRGFLSTGNATTGGLKLMGSGNDFAACPNGDGSYTVQVEETLPQGCTRFEMVLEETHAPAVQYYQCVGCEDRCYTNRCSGKYE